MHGAAFALGVSAFASGQLGHHTFWVHATSQHMAMVTIGGEALVAINGSRFQADYDRLLTDIEMAKPSNQTHPIKLTGFFLKSSDTEHIAVKLLIKLCHEPVF